MALELGKEASFQACQVSGTPPLYIGVGRVKVSGYGLGFERETKAGGQISQENSLPGLVFLCCSCGFLSSGRLFFSLFSSFFLFI